MACNFQNRLVLLFAFKRTNADMAELADALASGASDRKVVQVQVLLSAPRHYNPNPLILEMGEGFGFYFEQIM